MISNPTPENLRKLWSYGAEMGVCVLRNAFVGRGRARDEIVKPG